MAGVLPEGAGLEARTRHRATFVRNLRRAAREAAKQGVILTIEPINPRDIPGYFLNTQAEAHAIREEGGTENLLLERDFYPPQIFDATLPEKSRPCQPPIPP